MTSWIPSSIQKRLLRYALNKSGLLDVTGIDLDNLDISWGRRTTLEFKEVNLNVEYLVGLAQLPPNLRLESAKILSLRLTIPADIIGSGISVEVDGVDVVARLEETQEEEVQPWSPKASDRMPRGIQSPLHRKTSRRIQSPPFRGHGEGRLPTTEDLAKSFLAEEPLEERRELEASVAVNTAPMDESVFSESSDGSDIGTGAAPGLPGFLSNWLQRVIDRFEMKIGRIHVSLELDGTPASNPEDNTPTNLIAKLERVELLPGSTKREVRFGNLSIELVADKQTLSDLSHITSPASPASPTASRATKSSRHSEDILNRSFGDLFQQQHDNRYNEEPPASDDGLTTGNTNPSPDEPNATFTMAESHDTLPSLGNVDASINDLGIQMGDDNISWASRRSQGDMPTDDIWEGQQEDDMPTSLLLGINQPLPQSQSSAASSSPSRSRRAMSPYDRGFHGPGSWPRMDESPQSNRDRVGPGSWPAPDQSQSDLFLSMTSDNNEDPVDATDNKRSALEASSHEARLSPLPSASIHDDHQDGLEQSRYFSHEEAQSMYMSAVAATEEPQIPGAWESEIASRVDLEPPPVAMPDTDSQASNDLEARNESPTPAYKSGDRSSPPSEAATPRGSTPSPPTPMPRRVSLSKDAELATLQLLFVDAITIILPNQSGDGATSSPPTSTAPPDVPSNFTSNRATSQSLSMSRAGMPGAFSTYSQLSSSQRRGASSIIAERETFAQRYSKPETTEKPAPTIEVQVGAVRLQVDVSAAQLLYKISDTLVSSPVAKKPDDTSKEKNSMELLLSVELLDITLHQQLEQRLDQPLPHSMPGLLNLNTRQIRISSKPTQHNVRLGKLEFFLGGHKVLSFDQSIQALSESMIFEEDLRLLIDTSKFTNTSRPITNIGLESRPIRVDVDLSVFDDVFSTFGGLSGVLDIGNSMALDASPLASTVAPDRTQRVRFDDDAPVNETSPEYKANASVSGITFVLCADQTAVALQTGSMKAVYREKAASVRFSGSVRLSGPYLNNDSSAPLHVDLAGLWIHYLFTPQEQDLERLLALITPSKDKYDNDDDILIETLLRQRRKGSCLRLTLDDAKIKIDNFESLTCLQALSTQVSRLSAVTKYLPEDERPGLLSLIRVKNVELRVPVNDRFGTLQTTFKELQCAHVGLPALLALSLSNVVVAQSGGPELVHALVPLSGSDDLPMIMARMLDDEVEPIVKVKLYNVCVEYSVPILLDLTATDHGIDAEELVADLAASVVDLASSRRNESHEISANSQPAKRTHLCLLLHNSAVGLTPQKSASKGLFVLTDARASTTVPPSDTMNVAVELHQAGILVTDDMHAVHSDPSSLRRRAPESTVVDIRVLNALWKQGYASVGSIMSAVIDARIEQASGTAASSVEVDVRNDFFLLETCADSTQTLTAIMGGLSPPAPPSKRQKYLTEPITIEDMISSFSGDAYAKPERPMETLFDVDEEPLITESDFGDGPDDLLMDADMSSSLYGPIGGMIGDLDDGPVRADQDYGETVESLLDDDPFEMTISPDDMPFSDTALMRDLRQQALPAKSAEPVDLGNYEIEDLGFDALGVDEQALGTRYRFSAPTSRRNLGNKTTSGTKLPFKLRLRDVHATWHMHDGYDWQKTRDGITAAVEHVEQRAEERLARRRQARPEPEDEESTIGDCMFNSVYITIPSNLTETPDIRRGINRQIDDLVSESESVPASGMSRPTHYSAGGRPIHAPNRRRLKLERSRYHKISFEVKGASVDMDVFPPDSGELQSSVDVRLKQFEIFDNVPTSTWKKFLTQQHAAGTQELARPMVHIQLLSQKTVQERDATDLMIHVAVQPLRLHVDQDALDFITRFTEFKDSAAEPPSPSDQPFLSRVEIDTVDLQLDYKPKKVDYVGLRSGLATEFMNFVILDQAHIRLRHAIVYGIQGFEPLHKTLNDVWMPDVKRNQLPTILTGLAPIRSLANIGTGVRDVVAIPIREYKKDGRIVRSVQKGAFQFGKTTASELARLGAKVAMGTQNILSGAEGLLAPQPSSQASADRANNLSSDPADDEDREHRAYSAYADQPLGVLAGLRSARRYLEHDLLTARDALIAVQGEILESSNPGSAAMAVARHAPTVMLRPVIGASRAIGTTLLGVGNQIDRGGVKRMEDKYKRR